MTGIVASSWIDDFCRAVPAVRVLAPEARLSYVAEYLLSKLCADVEREYQITDGSQHYRIDLKGVLPNGEYALVEVKAFGQFLTPYVDAIMQAASYADAIEYPVFIGPVMGDKSSIVTGTHDNAIGALHLVAGRLNVGFLCVSRHGAPSLVLRGQRVMDLMGVSDSFATHWGYRTRRGSRTVRS